MMNRGGFAGNVLSVDLSASSIKSLPLDMSLAERFGGGLGLGIRLAFYEITPGVDALSPENVIVIATGALVGTNLPAASRIYSITKLPLSGSIGWCGAGGMSFGCLMKYAGYDFIIIKGRSDHPVYLKIIDDTAELCDAGSLWGSGIDKTTDILWDKFSRPLGIIAIGPAGENCCYASMAYVDRFSTLGRGGFGAVMGSKNLKAIVVRGSGGIGVAHRKRYHSLNNDLIKRIREYPYLKEWQDLGLMKSLPVIDHDIYLSIKKRRIACVSCPIGDKDIIEIRGNDMKGFTACSSSAVNLFTPMIYGFNDYREAVRLITFLDDLGLDMFEFFGVMSYLKELVDKGVISHNLIDKAIELNSFDSMESWAHLIAFRRGMGDVLARGMKAVAREFGTHDGDDAPLSVRGMFPYVGPRAQIPWDLLGTMELGQLLDPRGPHVGSGGSPTYFAKRPIEVFPKNLRRMGVADDAIDRILPGLNGVNRSDLRVGRLLKHSHTWFTILGSLGICARAQVNRFNSAELCAELYEAVTGIETALEDLRTRADRSWTLLRMANIREGFTKQDDMPPVSWFRDKGFRNYLTEEPLSRDEVIGMIEDYYDEQGWDPLTGTPLPERLKELDLDI